MSFPPPALPEGRRHSTENARDEHGWANGAPAASADPRQLSLEKTRRSTGVLQGGAWTRTYLLPKSSLLGTESRFAFVKDCVKWPMAVNRECPTRRFLLSHWRDATGIWRDRQEWSEGDHLEVFLAGAALRAGPVDGHVFPLRAGCDPVFGRAGGFVVDPSADQAHPGLVFHKAGSQATLY